MRRSLGFGQKIGIGFAAVAFFALVVGAIALYALQATLADKDRIISVYAQNVITAGDLQSEAERRVSFARGFFLIKENQILDDLRVSREQFDKLMATIRKQGVSAEEERLLAKIELASQSQNAASDRVIEARKVETNSLDKIAKQFQEEVVPRNHDLRSAIESFVQIEEQQMENGKRRSADLASFLGNLMIAVIAAGVFIAAVLAFFLSRMLSRQIGAAVQRIQNSSSELQTAANQQTTVSREQAASMSEIATTIKELVATARQIAESAKRVAGIADETTRGARSGDQTVKKTQEAVTNIRGQVDLIVSHMLDLGRKSQQIGGIVEVINELADQTNILSINASIEAAGAGEIGRRFAVVADEIRKLADRVSGSTKDIKSLIEEVRSAVHTTVMATESGSKAVDAGAQQFLDVSAAFLQIVRLVETTTEAAREIELSTKQQTTAVEQVNEAIADVAQASKESEVSSAQTLQTVTELTGLARELTRLIRPKAIQ